MGVYSTLCVSREAALAAINRMRDLHLTDEMLEDVLLDLVGVRFLHNFLISSSGEDDEHLERITT